jgi:hypothetical protein
VNKVTSNPTVVAKPTAEEAHDKFVRLQAMKALRR